MQKYLKIIKEIHSALIIVPTECIPGRSGVPFDSTLERYRVRPYAKAS